MFCISVSFKKTPLSIREQFSFLEEEKKIFLSELTEKKIITGGVLVTTCNRSELYFTGESCRMEEIECLLSSLKKINRENIKKYCLYYQGKKAVRHLFRVACGLDSMVLGEDEILRQLKEAYIYAYNSGFTDSELNIIFQDALNCAKLSKSETKLSSTPVSIGTLTANAAEKYLKEKDMDKKTGKQGKGVLVIGATGKIGSIVAKDLMAKGIKVFATSRKRQGTQELFFQNQDSIEWMDFDRRYDVVGEVSVIVSATTSPHYTLTKEEFLRHAKEERDYLLMDLAVPCDIDKELGKKSEISLLDIDYFQTLSKENNGIKMGEMEKAECILEECLEETLKKIYMRDFKEKMSGKCEEAWFQKMTYYLKDILDSESFFKVLDRIYRKENQEAM